MAIGLSVLVGEGVDALMIAVIVLFSAVLGFVQEYKAERALEALKKMLSPTITVLRDANEDEIPSRDLVPGDIILLEAGDKLPADGRLVEVRSLNCDEAALTGESIPVSKETAPLGEQMPTGDSNMVFAGTIVTYGRGKAVGHLDRNEHRVRAGSPKKSRPSRRKRPRWKKGPRRSGTGWASFPWASASV